MGRRSCWVYDKLPNLAVAPLLFGSLLVSGFIGERGFESEIASYLKVFGAGATLGLFIGLSGLWWRYEDMNRTRNEAKYLRTTIQELSFYKTN